MSGRWPDFFIVGAMKAATTSLYHYLDQHPGVFMPATKEPHFFSDYGPVTWGAQGPLPEAERAYRRLFRGAPEGALVGEASTSYLCDPEAPARIAERAPDARIVASLRDPVRRAHSHYLMNVRGGTLDRPLLEYLEALDRHGDDASWKWRHGFLFDGFFAEPVRRYLDLFGRDNVLVLTTGDLSRDKVGTLERVAEFLGVDPAPMRRVDTNIRFNAYGKPRNALAQRLRESKAVIRAAQAVVPLRLRRWVDERVLTRPAEKPALDPRAAAILQDIYAPDVEELEQVLGREMPDLRASWE